MSAARIREAAKVLRDAAENATPGPWQADGPFWWGGGNDSDCTTIITAGDDRLPVVVLPEDRDRRDTSDADALFVALMQPSVALALADWLDDVAVLWSGREFLRDDDGDPLTFCESIDSHALTIANTILGDRA